MFLLSLQGLRSADVSQVPSELNGRYERLYELRDDYEAAVANTATPKTDAQVKQTGLKLARAQRTATQDLQHRRMAASRAGTSINPATKNPETSADFLGLILKEQKEQTAASWAAAEAMAKVCSHL